MSTIYDVAKHAGVSIATVSAVINKSAYVSPELTKRVQAAVEELDYTMNHLAHALQTRTTRSVGMLIPDPGNPDPFYGQVVRGAEDVFRRKGYLLVIGHTYNDVEEQSRYLTAFRSRLVDGVLLFQAPGEDPELDRFLSEKRPVVFVGRIPPNKNVDVVATDIQLGTEMGVDHLCRLGRQRVGLIVIQSSLSVMNLRIAGWRAALKRHRLAAEDRYVVPCEFSSEGGRTAAETLLDLPDPPTAIFTDNLVVTSGVLRAMQERRLRCPEDVALVSSDDAEWLDVFQPPITTIIQPSYQLGVQAAETFLKRIRHPKRAWQRILLRPELKVRGDHCVEPQSRSAPVGS